MAGTWDELRMASVPTPKLNPVLAAEIRRRYQAGGETQQAIATDYGVSQVLISRVVRGVICMPQANRGKHGGPTVARFQANVGLNTAMHAGGDWRTWASARGYSEARIAAEEARMARRRPPARHICEPGTVCCAAVLGWVEPLAEAAD